MEVLILLLATGFTAATRQFTVEEESSFPNLFHLDHYDRCLAKKNGLYCLGIFDLTPDIEPNPTYELLKEYSAIYGHYNRTRIHRGYCVSTRCPESTERNVTLRFERCVDKWARAYTLRASINTFHYCQNYADRQTEKPRTASEQLFLQCVYAIIVLNIIGTIYDVYTGDSPHKNKLIAAFSIPANWRKLTSSYEGRDPRVAALAHLNGFRVMIIAGTSLAHASLLHHTVSISNPKHLEEKSHGVYNAYLLDGTSIVQALEMIACFLTGYNLLILSKTRSLSITMLPLCIIKRVIRIAPVNIIVIGYAATWWIHSRDGPLVPTTIGWESGACQRKFWSHMFFYNNLVDPADYCVVPTWFLAMDMHIYILASTLMLIMWRRRYAAVKFYSFLLIASCILTGVIAYIKEYKPLIYLSTPEFSRILFRSTPTFIYYYFSTWASLPSCFIGLIMAHIQFEIDERHIKLSDYKWLVYMHYILFPLVFVRGLAGRLFEGYESPAFYAVYIAVERPLYTILICTTLLGLTNIDSPMKRLFSWHGWTSIARMSLTVMLLHWCINLSIACKPLTYAITELDLVVDWVSTNVITFCIAVPVIILVEIPMQKFFGLLLLPF